MAQKRPNWWAMYRKYQEFQSDPHPISGVSARCAVRMSMSLAVVGLYSSQRFKSVVPKGATSKGWAIRAEELYQYLRNSSVLGEADLVGPASIRGKYGVVYLRDCWARAPARRRSTGRAITLISCIPNRDPIVR